MIPTMIPSGTMIPMIHSFGQPIKAVGGNHCTETTGGQHAIAAIAQRVRIPIAATSSFATWRLCESICVLVNSSCPRHRTPVTYCLSSLPGLAVAFVGWPTDESVGYFFMSLAGLELVECVTAAAGGRSNREGIIRNGRQLPAESRRTAIG